MIAALVRLLDALSQRLARADPKNPYYWRDGYDVGKVDS